MAKKQIEEKPVLDMVFSNYQVELVIGGWKTLFTSERVKLLLAESLNEWVHLHPRKLHLNGYLITSASMFLIYKAQEQEQHHILSSLYDIVIKTIEDQYTFRLNLEHQEHINSKMLYRNPFVKRQLFNDELIKLLTGKVVYSVYNNPQLVHLKEDLKHYKYCSVVDYLGGEGPVSVKLLK